MAGDIAHDEIRSFYTFLGERIEDDACRLTPEQSVQEFRAYQAELMRARAELKESHEQYVRGEAEPLDEKALMERVRTRLAREGITD